MQEIDRLCMKDYFITLSTSDKYLAALPFGDPFSFKMKYDYIDYTTKLT